MMNLASQFRPVVESLGWTLIHSLWQFSLVAAFTAVLLRVLRKTSPAFRYLLCCASLATTIGLPVATCIYLQPVSDQSAPAEPPSTPLAALPLSPSPIPSVLKPASSPPPRVESLVQSLLPYLVFAYLAGCILLAARLALGYCHLRHLRRHATPVSAELRSLAAALRRRLAMPAPVELLHSREIEVPTVLGFLRPVILLPLSISTGLSQDQLAAVIVHELAHIQRHDHLFNLLQTLAETLLFYHPAVWWLSGQIRCLREYCCDDRTIDLGTSPLIYAAALAQIESLRPPLSPSLSIKSSPLLPRIRRILTVHPTRPAHLPPFLFSLTTIIALALPVLLYLGCNQAKNQPRSASVSSAYSVVRIYDIHDLVDTADRPTIPPHMGSAKQPPVPDLKASSTAPAPPDRARRQQIHLIIQAIQDSVAPQTWRDRGGELGAIHEQSGQLIVNQTVENQTAVYRFIQDLRQNASRKIAFDMRLILIDETTFETLELPRQKFPEPVVNSRLDTDQSARLIELLQKSPASTVITPPQWHLLNSRSGYTGLTTQRSYISGFQQSANTLDKTIVTKPDFATLTTGISWNFFPLISRSPNAVVLKTQFTLCELEKMDSYSLPDSVDKNLRFEIPHTNIQTFTSTQTIPDGAAWLLGGTITHLDASDLGFSRSESNLDHPARRLLLLITPHILSPNPTPSIPSSAPAPRN